MSLKTTQSDGNSEFFVPLIAAAQDRSPSNKFTAEHWDHARTTVGEDIFNDAVETLRTSPTLWTVKWSHKDYLDAGQQHIAIDPVNDSAPLQKSQWQCVASRRTKKKDHRHSL